MRSKKRELGIVDIDKRDLSHAVEFGVCRLAATFTGARADAMPRADANTATAPCVFIIPHVSQSVPLGSTPVRLYRVVSVTPNSNASTPGAGVGLDAKSLAAISTVDALEAAIVGLEHQERLAYSATDVLRACASGCALQQPDMKLLIDSALSVFTIAPSWSVPSTARVAIESHAKGDWAKDTHTFKSITHGRSDKAWYCFWMGADQLQCVVNQAGVAVMAAVLVSGRSASATPSPGRTQSLRDEDVDAFARVMQSLAGGGASGVSGPSPSPAQFVGGQRQVVPSPEGVDLDIGRDSPAHPNPGSRSAVLSAALERASGQDCDHGPDTRGAGGAGAVPGPVADDAESMRTVRNVADTLGSWRTNVAMIVEALWAEESQRGCTPREQLAFLGHAQWCQLVEGANPSQDVGMSVSSDRDGQRGSVMQDSDVTAPDVVMTLLPRGASFAFQQFFEIACLEAKDLPMLPIYVDAIDAVSNASNPLPPRPSDSRAARAWDIAFHRLCRVVHTFFLRFRLHIEAIVRRAHHEYVGLLGALAWHERVTAQTTARQQALQAALHAAPSANWISGMMKRVADDAVAELAAALDDDSVVGWTDVYDNIYVTVNRWTGASGETYQSLKYGDDCRLLFRASPNLPSKWFYASQANFQCEGDDMRQWRFRFPPTDWREIIAKPEEDRIIARLEELEQADADGGVRRTMWEHRDFINQFPRNADGSRAPERDRRGEYPVETRAERPTDANGHPFPGALSQDDADAEYRRQKYSRTGIRGGDVLFQAILDADTNQYWGNVVWLKYHWINAVPFRKRHYWRNISVDIGIYDFIMRLIAARPQRSGRTWAQRSAGSPPIPPVQDRREQDRADKEMLVKRVRELMERRNIPSIRKLADHIAAEAGPGAKVPFQRLGELMAATGRYKARLVRGRHLGTLLHFLRADALNRSDLVVLRELDSVVADRNMGTGVPPFDPDGAIDGPLPDANTPAVPYYPVVEENRTKPASHHARVVATHEEKLQAYFDFLMLTDPARCFAEFNNFDLDTFHPPNKLTHHVYTRYLALIYGPSWRMVVYQGKVFANAKSGVLRWMNACLSVMYATCGIRDVLHAAISGDLSWYTQAEWDTATGGGEAMPTVAAYVPGEPDAAGNLAHAKANPVLLAILYFFESALVVTTEAEHGKNMAHGHNQKIDFHIMRTFNDLDYDDYVKAMLMKIATDLYRERGCHQGLLDVHRIRCAKPQGSYGEPAENAHQYQKQDRGFDTAINPGAQLVNRFYQMTQLFHTDTAIQTNVESHASFGTMLRRGNAMTLPHLRQGTRLDDDAGATTTTNDLVDVDEASGSEPLVETSDSESGSEPGGVTVDSELDDDDDIAAEELERQLAEGILGEAMIRQLTAADMSADGNMTAARAAATGGSGEPANDHHDESVGRERSVLETNSKTHGHGVVNAADETNPQFAVVQRMAQGWRHAIFVVATAGPVQFGADTSGGRGARSVVKTKLPTAGEEMLAVKVESLVFQSKPLSKEIPELVKKLRAKYTEPLDDELEACRWQLLQAAPLTPADLAVLKASKEKNAAAFVTERALRKADVRAAEKAVKDAAAAAAKATAAAAKAAAAAAAAAAKATAAAVAKATAAAARAAAQTKRPRCPAAVGGSNRDTHMGAPATGPWPGQSPQHMMGMAGHWQYAPLHTVTPGMSTEAPHMMTQPLHTVMGTPVHMGAGPYYGFPPSFPSPGWPSSMPMTMASGPPPPLGTVTSRLTAMLSPLPGHHGSVGTVPNAGHIEFGASGGPLRAAPFPSNPDTHAPAPR